jgi:hypothetical protein
MGSGVSVGCIIFGVIIGCVISVGVAAAGMPQDEIITAMTRNINNFLFMFTLLYKIKFLHASIARGAEYLTGYLFVEHEPHTAMDIAKNR